MPTSPPGRERSRRVVLFLDVVESVRILCRHEERFIDCWLVFVQRLRDEILVRRGGTMVKSLGDGCLLTFGVPIDAVQAAFDALALARTFDQGLPSDAQMHFRIGIHLAEVVVGVDDLFGSGVNLAARIAGLGGPDEVLITGPVRQDLAEGLTLRVTDTGDHWLKHLDEPVRVWKVAPIGVSATSSGLPAALEVRPAIAVIPFVRRGSAHGVDGLGQAVSARIASALMPCPLWRVISSLSTMSCILPERPVTLGPVLKAAYLVTGDFGEVNGQIELQAQLTDAQSGELLWFSPPQRLRVSSLFDGVDDILESVAQGISRALFNTSLGRTGSLPLSRLDDYCLHLSSLALMHRLRPRDHVRAGEMLSALELRHSRSAEPYALRCRWHALRMVQGYAEQPANAGLDALWAARYALEREPDHRFALPMAALLSAQMGESLVDAEADAGVALTTHPHEPMAGLAYGLLRGYLGDSHDFEVYCDAAIDLSPLDPAIFVYRSIQASAKISANKPVDAEEAAAVAIRANPTYATAHLMMTVSLAMQDKLVDARRSAQRLLELKPQFTVGRHMDEFGGVQPPNAQDRAHAMKAAGLPP